MPTLLIFLFTGKLIRELKRTCDIVDIEALNRLKDFKVSFTVVDKLSWTLVAVERQQWMYIIRGHIETLVVMGEAQSMQREQHMQKNTK